MIWRNANVPQYDVPSPTDFGYEVDSTGNLKPVMMTQSVAAPELLNDMVCHCEQCDMDCVCSLSAQPCTYACSCKAESASDDETCTNIHTLKLEINKDQMESEFSD